MDDKDKSDPASEFGTDSSWSPLADGVYFFPGDRESNILSEFGWNFQQDVSNRDRYGDLDLIVADERSDLAGSSTGGGVSGGGGTVGISEPASASVRDGSSSVTTTSNNPSVSSSSSEDQPDKYTDSGGKPPPEKP